MSTVESVAEVLADLRSFLNDALATQAYARMGLIHEYHFTSAFPVTPDNPDPTIFLTAGDPGEAMPFSQWRRSEVLIHLSQLGPVEQRLSQQWIVYVSPPGSTTIAPRLERAHGLERDALKIPLLGDLRLLRNDVVHHHGIASADNSGRCELLRHWVTIGEPILVTQDHFDEFWTTSRGRNWRPVRHNL